MAYKESWLRISKFRNRYVQWGIFKANVQWDYVDTYSSWHFWISVWLSFLFTMLAYLNILNFWNIPWPLFGFCFTILIGLLWETLDSIKIWGWDYPNNFPRGGSPKIHFIVKQIIASDGFSISDLIVDMLGAFFGAFLFIFSILIIL